jgi:endonuclease YncB( thermonuclease family)
MRYLLLFLLAFNVYAGNNIVTRVVDGDTVEFEAKWLPPELGDTLKLRIWGIDTPEKGWRGKCDYEKELGQQATDYVTDLVVNAKKVNIELKEWDKFGGRVLGDLFIDGVSIRDLLINKGLAREYYGDKKKSWCP